MSNKSQSERREFIVVSNFSVDLRRNSRTGLLWNGLSFSDVQKNKYLLFVVRLFVYRIQTLEIHFLLARCHSSTCRLCVSVELCK